MIKHDKSFEVHCTGIFQAKKSQVDFLFFLFKIGNTLGFGDTSYEAVEHEDEQGFKGKFLPWEELRVVEVDQAADVKPGHQFNAQVIAVDALADAFGQVDLNFPEDKVDPFLEVLLVDLRVMFLEFHRDRRGHIHKFPGHFLAYGKKDIYGIYPFKIMCIKNILEAVPLKLQDLLYQFVIVLSVI